MTPDERLRELVEILALMESIERPDREAHDSPREALPEGWLAIIERRRRGRQAG